MKTAEQIRLTIAALPIRNTATLRQVRRDYSQRLAKSDAAEVLAVARALVRSPLRWIAYELVQHHPDAMSGLRRRDVEELGLGMASWADVDTFACFIAGPAWQARQIPDSVIHAWARSRDRWWRRAALVSTVALNCRARGGTGDTPRTLRVCKMLAGDCDDMVVKALSWALRELAKRDAPAVRKFLAATPVAARVSREVRNKLTTGVKSGNRAKQDNRRRTKAKE